MPPLGGLIKSNRVIELSRDSKEHLLQVSEDQINNSVFLGGVSLGHKHEVVHVYVRTLQACRGGRAIREIILGSGSGAILGEGRGWVCNVEVLNILHHLRCCTE